MSKLYVVSTVNGNLATNAITEWDDNEQGAIVAFHQRCAALWNASDAYTAMVKILNENLDVFQGKQEYITHPQPEPEPPEEEPEG